MLLILYMVCICDMRVIVKAGGGLVGHLVTSEPTASESLSSCLCD